MDCLGVTTGEMLYFRCASEAIEWLSKQFCTDEVWCSPYEHDSVYNASDNVLSDDNINTYMLQEYSLYCHQLVNQLTGDVFDIKTIHDKYITQPTQFFGVDLTAAIGHIELPNNLDTFCDALWFSGHKFYCEKGIGGLWISDRLREFIGDKIIHGTVDVAGVKMMAEAMLTVHNTMAITEYNYLYRQMLNILPDMIPITSSNAIERTPYINMLYIPNVNAEALQQYLATKYIYVGIGNSACGAKDDYRVLQNMGISKEIARNCIRISFGRNNTEDDVQDLCKEINNFREIFI